MDHGALLPFVVVFTPRKGGHKAAGIDVWVGGLDEKYCKQFAEELLA